MKRTSSFIFASTLLLMCPTYAFAQYDSSYQRSNSAMVLLALPASPALPASRPIADPIVQAQSVEGATLNGRVSKYKRIGRHPQPLSLKIGEDQLAPTLLTGSTFSIELDNNLNSKEATTGDKVLGHLTQDLQVGSVLLAPKGAKVEGSVHKVFTACRGIKSNKLNGHFRNSNGGIQVEFTRLVGNDGVSYPISAVPAAGSTVQKLSSQEQKMVIGKHGEIGVPYHTKRCETLAVAISAGSMAAGPFGFAAAPAISALIGGICPSYGLGRPAKPDEKHARVKGALMGALRGSPGGFLTSGFLVHGLDAKISSGDQMILELSQPFSIPTAGKEISSNQQLPY